MERVENQEVGRNRKCSFALPSHRESQSQEWLVISSVEEEGGITILTETGRVLTLHPSTALVLATKAHQYKAVKSLTDKSVCLVESIALAQLESQPLEGFDGKASKEELDYISAQIKLRGCILTFAVNDGDLEEVERVTKKGPITDRARSSAVFQAMQAGHMEIADYLLSTGEILRDEVLKDIAEHMEKEQVDVAINLLDSRPSLL